MHEWEFGAMSALAPKIRLLGLFPKKFGDDVQRQQVPGRV